MKLRRKGKAVVRAIALERIYRLFELAEMEFDRGNKERANRYVELARKIISRNKAVIPAELKKRFCKKCNAFLKRGKNSAWKKTAKGVEISCMECGAEFKRRLE